MTSLHDSSAADWNGRHEPHVLRLFEKSFVLTVLRLQRPGNPPQAVPAKLARYNTIIRTVSPLSHHVWDVCTTV